METQSSNIYNVGLALSGGGARGFVHMGVLKALEERGIKPQIISGVSAGSVVAVLYASGVPFDDFISACEKASFSDLVDIIVPKMGFFKMDKFKKLLKRFIPYENIEDLPIPLHIVATDIDHGKTHVFKSGSIIERVSASCSMPIVFNPVKIEGVNYVDGGVLRNLPAWTIRKECKHLIGVNCSPFVNYKFTPTIIEVAMRSYQLMSKVNTVHDMRMCDTLIIASGIANHKTFDLKSIREVIQYGYDLTCRVLDKKDDFNIEKSEALLTQ